MKLRRYRYDPARTIHTKMEDCKLTKISDNIMEFPFMICERIKNKNIRRPITWIFMFAWLPVMGLVWLPIAMVGGFIDLNSEM